MTFYIHGCQHQNGATWEDDRSFFKLDFWTYGENVTLQSCLTCNLRNTKLERITKNLAFWNNDHREMKQTEWYEPRHWLCQHYDFTSPKEAKEWTNETDLFGYGECKRCHQYKQKYQAIFLYNTLNEITLDRSFYVLYWKKVGQPTRIIRSVIQRAGPKTHFERIKELVTNSLR